MCGFWLRFTESRECFLFLSQDALHSTARHYRQGIPESKVYKVRKQFFCLFLAYLYNLTLFLSPISCVAFNLELNNPESFVKNFIGRFLFYLFNSLFNKKKFPSWFCNQSDWFCVRFTTIGREVKLYKKFSFINNLYFISLSCRNDWDYCFFVCTIGCYFK